MVRRLVLAPLVSIVGVLLVPPAAPAQTGPPLGWEGLLRYAGDFGTFRIAAAPTAPSRTELYVGTVMTPTPDIVFTSATGVVSPGLPCIGPDPNTVRCPLMNVAGLDLSMGDDVDEVETVNVSGPSISGFKLRIDMGAGDDRWLGGPLGEKWYGNLGNDFARGGAGNDRFSAGPGNDRMFGGLGIDFFKGQTGRDFARGGPGNDRGSGGPGNDDFKD